MYLTTLRARLRCPVLLLVVCVDAGTASRCARPIDLGHPGLVLAPVVLGPREVPLVTDAAAAAEWPELAVLSALAHITHPELEKILYVLPHAFAAADPARTVQYSDIVLVALPEAARHYLEGLMTSQAYEYKSDFVRRYVFQGKAEGEALALLTVLETRGIAVPQEARERIAECTDLELLDLWIRRAVTADSISGVLD